LIIIDSFILLDKSVVAVATAMYQEQVLRYKHLDEGRFVFECILAGNFQTFFYM